MTRRLPHVLDTIEDLADTVVAVATSPTPVGDALRLFGAAAAAAGTVLAVWRWLVPVVRRRFEDRQALRTLLYGRPAIPANPISGAAEQPEVLGIGPAFAQHIEIERASLAELKDQTQQLQGQVTDLTTAFTRLAENDARVTELAGDVAIIRDGLAELRGLVLGTPTGPGAVAEVQVAVGDTGHLPHG